MLVGWNRIQISLSITAIASLAILSMPTADFINSLFQLILLDISFVNNEGNNSMQDFESSNLLFYLCDYV